MFYGPVSENKVLLLLLVVVVAAAAAAVYKQAKIYAGHEADHSN